LSKKAQSRLIKIKSELEKIDKDLEFFLKKNKMNNEEFIEKFNNGEIGDEEDYFVWGGSFNVRKNLVKSKKS